MKKDLIILGGSGIGMIASSIADVLGYNVRGFLNDVVPVGAEIGKYKKIPVIGTTEDVPVLLKEDVSFFIAYVGLQNEKDTFDKIDSLEIPQDRFANLIHPTAVIPSDYCRIGNGVLFAPLSQLSPDTTIEDNCILLPNSFVGHDSTMHRFAHIATNSVIGANVHVGRAVHVGSNATVREKVTIGDFSLVGAGSVILKDVAPNSIVVGNPARILKQR